MSIKIYDEKTQTYKDIENINKYDKDTNTWVECDKALVYNNVWEEKYSNIEYFDQLVNYTMLYDSGNQCTSLTGGWTGQHIYDGTSYGSTSLQSNYIYTTTTRAYGNAGGCALRTTAKTISFAGYYRIGAVGKATTTNTPKLSIYTGVSTTNTNSYGRGTQVATAETTTNNKKITMSGNISSYSASIVGVGVDYYFNNNGTYSLNVYNVFLLKEDDWQTLVEKAGVTTSATGVSTLVTDTEAIRAILNNQNAVNFMTAQCTGDFMVGFIGNVTCLSLLSDSPYESVIRANEHWNKFLSMLN